MRPLLMRLAPLWSVIGSVAIMLFLARQVDIRLLARSITRSIFGGWPQDIRGHLTSADLPELFLLVCVIWGVTTFGALLINKLFHYEMSTIVWKTLERRRSHRILGDIVWGAVWEEIVFRWLPLGLILPWVLRRVTEPTETARLLAGGLIFQAFNGFWAGLHMREFTKEQRKVWRILPHMLAGMFLGFVFWRYGLFATVLVHTTVNCLNYALDKKFPVNGSTVAEPAIWLLGGLIFSVTLDHAIKPEMLSFSREALAMLEDPTSRDALSSLSVNDGQMLILLISMFFLTRFLARVLLMDTQNLAGRRLDLTTSAVAGLLAAILVSAGLLLTVTVLNMHPYIDPPPDGDSSLGAQHIPTAVTWFKEAAGLQTLFAQFLLAGLILATLMPQGSGSEALYDLWSCLLSSYLFLLVLYIVPLTTAVPLIAVTIFCFSLSDRLHRHLVAGATPH